VRSASPVIAVLLFQRLLKRSNIHGNLVALFLAVSWPFFADPDSFRPYRQC
jgi:hypothetical protein